MVIMVGISRNEHREVPEKVERRREDGSWELVAVESDHYKAGGGRQGAIRGILAGPVACPALLRSTWPDGTVSYTAVREDGIPVGVDAPDR